MKGFQNRSGAKKLNPCAGSSPIRMHRGSCWGRKSPTGALGAIGIGKAMEKWGPILPYEPECEDRPERDTSLVVQWLKPTLALQKAWVRSSVWEIRSHMHFCDPMDYSPPGSSVHGIRQAGILELVAFPSPGDLPDPGIEPRSPALWADSLQSQPPGKPPGICLAHCKCCLSICFHNKWIKVS